MREIRYFSFLTVLLTAILFTGCEYFGNDNLTSAGIAESGLIINFIEDSDPGENPELFLHLKTVQIFGCVNILIDYSWDKYQVKSLRKLFLLGFKMEGIDCATGAGPAQAKIPLSESSYLRHLIIIDGEEKDFISVDITTEKVELTLDQVDFTQTTHNRLYRKPVNSFYTWCRPGGEPGLCEQFRQELLSDPAVSPLTFPDDGEWPYPRDNELTGEIYHYFLYENEEDFNRIKNLHESFVFEKVAEANGSLHIVNWQNETFFSHLMLN